MNFELLKGSVDPRDGYGSIKYKLDFRRQHPEYFDPEGLLIFCGPQGSGKTLSAVQYCCKILDAYPQCLFCSNVSIAGYEDRTIPYDGIKTLGDLTNGFAGVLYLIDEIHLEFNSLESKSISVEEMIEFAQQRKQRKHIVGTSQVFMRLAKPLREQIKNVVLCRNYFGLIQANQLIDGTSAYEEGGKLQANVIKRLYWFHTGALYGKYDTYAKMKRYKEAWGGRQNAPAALPYDSSGAGMRNGRNGQRIQRQR